MGRKKKELRQLTELPLSAISLVRGMSAGSYGEERVADLARSLAGGGLREPILVKRSAGDGRYGLVMGGCRYLAAEKLGWKTIAALVLEPSLGAEIKIIEKLRLDGASPWEVADTLLSLKEKLDWTQAHLGQAIGKSRDFVANMLAIAQITPETRGFILARQNGAALTARHLRYVARAPENRQMQVARRILERELSTTALEHEQRGSAPREPVFRISNLREPRKAGSPGYPTTRKEWKGYHRQLTTDLRRIDRQEALEQKRVRETIAEARLWQRLVKQEATRKRRELQRELRAARRQLGPQGL